MQSHAKTRKPAWLVGPGGKGKLKASPSVLSHECQGKPPSAWVSSASGVNLWTLFPEVQTLHLNSLTGWQFEQCSGYQSSRPRQPSGLLDCLINIPLERRDLLVIAPPDYILLLPAYYLNCVPISGKPRCRKIRTLFHSEILKHLWPLCLWKGVPN